MMDVGGEKTRRRVGDYIIGPRIGSGSFSVVWRSKHRHLGTEFAIKEIDKKHMNENLLKEISILRNITHPNIIQLFEVIEAESRIYLVLEYCQGGDLASYITRHGRVSEDVARHFMRQLAAGLQVIRDSHLIHRDIKPQNLLLSSKDGTPLLKVGDFGFARYLTHQDLADTLCGTPLYMAPEIIKNQKYDGKADLWSVGAILFQLVIGKPPFYGKSQLELFHNVLTTSELRFPEGALKVLHPDCVELCRSLLRHNPVERLSFEEFFNHKFLVIPRVTGNAEQSHSISLSKRPEGHIQNRHQFQPEIRLTSNDGDAGAALNDVKGDVHGFIPNTSNDKLSRSLSDDPVSSSQPRVADSMESIERSYVIVNSYLASTETVTSFGETHLQESSTSKTRVLPPQVDKSLHVTAQAREPSAATAGIHESLKEVPNSSTVPTPLHVLHPSRRLNLLHQYISVVSDIAQQKLNEGLFLEAFSVELVVLAVWEEAIRTCRSWLAASSGSNGSSIANETKDSSAPAQVHSGASANPEEITNFTEPSLASLWARRGFIAAYYSTERLSKYLQGTDELLLYNTLSAGSTEMPEAVDIIFQAALDAGRNGAVDELMEKQEDAAMSYSKATLLLSFILAEAPSLPLNPPFLLTPANKLRIQKYIRNLESHQNRARMPRSSIRHSSGSDSFAK